MLYSSQQIGLEETIIKEIGHQHSWYGHVQRMAKGRLSKIAFKWMPKQKRARGRTKKNWMEGIRKAMNERNLNEGQWEDMKQWSLGVGQRRKTFWNRYIYIYIYICIYICFKTVPIPVAAQTKAFVCGHSLVWIEVSSPAEDMVCLYVCCECCVLSGRGLWSLVQRGPTDCGVSECDREASVTKKPWPTEDCWAMKKCFEINGCWKSFQENTEDSGTPE